MGSEVNSSFLQTPILWSKNLVVQRWKNSETQNWLSHCTVSINLLLAIDEFVSETFLANIKMVSSNIKVVFCKCWIECLSSYLIWTNFISIVILIILDSWLLKRFTFKECLQEISLSTFRSDHTSFTLTFSYLLYQVNLATSGWNLPQLQYVIYAPAGVIEWSDHICWLTTVDLSTLIFLYLFTVMMVININVCIVWLFLIQCLYLEIVLSTVQLSCVIVLNTMPI